MAFERWRIDELNKVAGNQQRGFVVLLQDGSQEKPLHHFFLPLDAPPEYVQANVREYYEANSAVHGLGGVVVRELTGPAVSEQIHVLEQQEAALQP